MVRQRKCNLLLKRGRILPPPTREGVAEGMGVAEGQVPDRPADEGKCPAVSESSPFPYY